MKATQNSTICRGMTTAELRQQGVKLSLAGFDGKLHFDFETKGGRLEALQAEGAVDAMITAQMKTVPGLLGSLPYAELMNAGNELLTQAEPDDFRFRVFGETAPEDSAQAQVKWYPVDFESCVKKLWKRLTAGIVPVWEKPETGAEAELFAQAGTVEASEQLGCVAVRVNAQVMALDLAAMRNISEVIYQGERVCFVLAGDWGSIALKNGMLITFTAKEGGTGMMGEKKEVFLGVYNPQSRQYYTVKVE